MTLNEIYQCSTLKNAHYWERATDPTRACRFILGINEDYPGAADCIRILEGELQYLLDLERQEYMDVRGQPMFD